MKRGKPVIRIALSLLACIGVVLVAWMLSKGAPDPDDAPTRAGVESGGPATGGAPPEGAEPSRPEDRPSADPTQGDALAFWPQWRGPLGTGVAPHADPPTSWSEDEHVRWKMSVPGKGHSTPVVWGDRVYLTTAIPYGEDLPPTYSDAPGAHTIQPITNHHRFVVLAIDRHDGAVVWKRTVREALPHEGFHAGSSLASPSPVTDGESLYAFFGSQGLYCLDHDGRVIWETDLGDMQTLHSHGEGSSPALYQDSLIILWDHEGASFLAAFDKRTGEPRWKVDREVRSSSWTTPIVVEAAKGPQIVVSGSEHLRGYDPTTGEEIWRRGGLSVKNVVASPVADDGVVFAGSSYDQRSVLAVRLVGSGGESAGSPPMLWKRDRGAPYVPSPLLYDDALYLVAGFHNILTPVDARTGEDRSEPIRLDDLDQVFASPVGAAGRIYLPGRNGATAVISHEADPAVIAINHLDDRFSASPALAGRQLFLRGADKLYCIEEIRDDAP